MVAMIVNLPSGFVFNPYETKDLMNTIQLVKRHNLKEMDTQLHLYINGLTVEKKCFPVHAERIHMVAQLGQSYVHVYDYNDLGRSMTVFYKPPATSVCEICKGDVTCVMPSCM